MILRGIIFSWILTLSSCHTRDRTCYPPTDQKRIADSLFDPMAFTGVVVKKDRHRDYVNHDYFDIVRVWVCTGKAFATSNAYSKWIRTVDSVTLSLRILPDLSDKYFVVGDSFYKYPNDPVFMVTGPKHDTLRSELGFTPICKEGYCYFRRNDGLLCWWFFHIWSTKFFTTYLIPHSQWFLSRAQGSLPQNHKCPCFPKRM